MPLETEEDSRSSEDEAPSPKKEKAKDSRREKEILALAALLLLCERKTFRRVSRIMQDATLAFAGQAALVTAEQRRGTYAQAEALYRVEARSKALGSDLETAFSQGRAMTRAAVADWLMRQYKDIPPPSVAASKVRDAEDRIRSQVAASSLQDAWTRAHLTASEKGTKKALREAGLSMTPKVDRAVTTENAQAFSAEVDTRFRDRDAYVLEWIAVLDKRTCNECATYNGARFEGKRADALPPIHPGCRCFVVPRRK